jgi:hypothetical protein
LKFGFSLDEDCNEYTYNDDCEFILGRVKDSKCWFSYNIKMDGGGYFEYVHQLQNLFFALTEKELKIQIL